jgi:hypothetical protein
MNKVADLLALTAMVAGITTIVSRPASADIIRAFGQAWSSSLLAAQGFRQ